MKASRALIIAAAMLLSGAAPSRASTPGLVVDAASGKVLFAERATDPWFPASVTKLMTTYVALDLVRQRQAAMDTLLTMSPGAAAQPPSKIGLKPGMTMTLDNALKIIMVKSANDIATMIGENLGGGSVEGFADLMNAAARRLGMRESRWTNPSGLPDDRQQTSARDMAILARALINDFPEHEHLFRIGAVKLGNKVMRNHNGMLGRYPGADGMKTGFICAGGFNIVASATQNGRRVIAVVFGYNSASERDLRAADLFDTGFSSLGWGAQQLESLAPSSLMTPPNMRPIVCGPKRRQPQEDEELVASGPGGSGVADNPIASLFMPSALASGGGTGQVAGSRRTLGPRVAFEPILVWAGRAPGGAAPDETDGRVQTAAAPIRPKRIGRATGGPLPVAAQAFTAAEPAPVLDGVALRGRREPPRNLGAVGSAGGDRERALGAIAAKPRSADAVLEGVNPDIPTVRPAVKSAAGKPAPAPKRTASKPAAKPALGGKPAPVKPVQADANAGG